ncbi:Farnesylated proteins-converting enzyme 2 [Aphelenchoides bicaudatus]|nr:Farnesylated proteins-converting enzyme 2 [Aphelenchoides bicaudatus]
MYWTYAGTVIAIPICYVYSLYSFDRHNYHTDHPLTIKKRLLGVTVSTTAICIWTYFLLGQNNDNPARLMGLFIDENVVWNSLKAVSITSSVYLGTFLMHYFDGSLSSLFSYDACTISFFAWLRNMVVAPISEELVFRSCLAVLLRLCTNESIALYAGPLFFSMCHYHHIKNDVNHGSTLFDAFSQRSVQAAYTYVFGIYATYIFFGTGNVLPSIFAHALCNYLELPRVFDVGSIRPKSVQPLIYLTHILGVGLFVYSLSLI